ncbi:hypothetical protein [Acetobacter estunensis]|uniref:AfsR/SARP family transcriptional regulator n=1 Tax=Acetobacter estunensis TaxID=104097 RepID=UPI001C2D443A|nr:hypothetical protein [Acetobacter estunensis]MBV1837834.1 hypothetical protein [Acetobacter estunensis]
MPTTQSNILHIRLIGHTVAMTATSKNILPAGARRTRALLAVLALSNRKPVTRQRLTELLWSKRPTDLARASLRQEIRRLLDLLQPSGPEIIECGRHTLMLKPGCASVDIEEIYAGNISMLDNSAEPEEMLFADLYGIDPAFDLWLHTHRERFSRHFQHLMKSAQTAENDPICISIPTSSSHQHNSASGDVASPSLFPPTWASLKPFHDHNLPHLTGFPSQKNGVSILEPSYSCEASEIRPSSQNTENESVSSSLYKDGPLILAFMPLETKDPSLTALADELGSQLHALFVGSDAFRLVVTRSSHEELNTTTDWIETLRQKNVDFLWTGSLHPDANSTQEHMALLLRLIDVQNEGEIIWIIRTSLPMGTRQNPALADSLLSQAALSAQWTIILRHARSTLKVSIQTLTPNQMAARALVILLQAHPHALQEAETLLKFAEWLGPNQPLVAIARTILEITRTDAFLSNDYETGITRTLIAAQHVAVLSQHNLSRNFLLAFVYSHIPGYAETADALLSTFQITDESPFQAWLAPYRILQARLALLNEREKMARALLKHYCVSGNGHPLSLAMDPCVILYLFLADMPKEASRIGRMFTAFYPQLPSALVYHLVALTTEGNTPERSDILARLLALDPTFTTRRVLASHPYLPIKAHAKLAAALRLTGLPE